MHRLHQVESKKGILRMLRGSAVYEQKSVEIYLLLSLNQATGYVCRIASSLFRDSHFFRSNSNIF